MHNFNAGAASRSCDTKRIATSVVAIILMFGISAERSLAADAEPTADELRLARLVLENKIAAERFGKPATGLEGKVDGGNNLGNLAYNFQPKAYDDVAKIITAQLMPGITDGKNVVITSRQNFGGLAASARLISDSVESLVSRGLGVLPAAQRPTTSCGQTVGTTAPSLLAAAGAIESMVSLFRTDYTVGTTAITSNDLGLKLSVNSALGDTAHIDGLDLVQVVHSSFLLCLQDLDNLKLRILATNPGKDSPGATFVAAAELAQSALSKPADSGMSAGAGIASLLNLAEKASAANGGVLYLSAVNSFATTVSSRRLLSRNGKVRVYLTGTINAAFSNPKGEMKGDTFTLGEVRTIDLKRLMKDGGTTFDAKTGN